MNNLEIKALGEKYVMNTYGRLPVALVEGKGSYVYDADGKEYLDFLGGIAVNALGHANEKLVKAISEQAGKMIHCSNLYWIESQVKLAQTLCDNSCLHKVFFCNSGAEANEGAIKLARKYSADKYSPERHVIITMEKSFHGRTMATLTATGQDKFHKDFLPLLAGFRYAPFNDLKALKENIDDKVCAIMLEPIQGEGGIFPVDETYLKEVKKICEEKDILLIFDEVQCGIGRTGKFFAYENYGVQPDIVTLAKGLGGGVPIGALMAKDFIAQSFKPGDHGSTFGGNPLATAAALAVVEEILNPGFLYKVNEISEYFWAKLTEMKEKYEFVKEVRGLGLMVGMDLSFPGKKVVDKAFENGVLFNCTNDTTLRFLPPLNINEEEVDKLIGVLDNILNDIAVNY